MFMRTGLIYVNAGFRETLSYYREKIEALLQCMIYETAEVLPHNRYIVNMYWNSTVHPDVDKLLCAINRKPVNRALWDSFLPFVESQESRLQDSLQSQKPPFAIHTAASIIDITKQDHIERVRLIFDQQEIKF